MFQYFTLDSNWVAKVGEAIGSRQGVLLKDCLVAAEEGKAVKFTDASSTTLSAATGSAYQLITQSTSDYLRVHPLLSAAPPPPPRGGGGKKFHQDPTRSSTSGGHELIERECDNCARTALRVAIAGGLAAYVKEHRHIIRIQVSTCSTATGGEHGSSNSGANLATLDDDEDEEVQLQRSHNNILLKGFLFAFESFLEMHSMNREHYPHRVGNRTAGTVGWDTLILLYFVHHIPQIARCASGEVVDDATGQIVRSWRKLLVAVQNADPSEAPEHSRRRGALAIVNGLLTILFHRHNTHQCAVLLRAVGHAESVAESTKDWSKSILHPSQHMTSEVITYYYYKGRMCLYERRLDEAHKALSEAYKLLPPPGVGIDCQQRNKQRTRFFFCVAGVARGRRIPDEILAGDAVVSSMFAPLVRAMERGDVIAFNNALEAFGTTFRRRGVYLILQQAKLMCYLMLLARTHALMATIAGTDNSRITLSTLTSAYHAIIAEGKTIEAGEAPAACEPAKSPMGRLPSKRAREDAEKEQLAIDSMDEDRMALWVAKLIARGYVRGYLSYEHKTVVLSKKEPFPLLTSSL